MTPSENAAIACIQFKSFSFKRRKNPSSQFNNLKIDLALKPAKRTWLPGSFCKLGPSLSLWFISTWKWLILLGRVCIQCSPYRCRTLTLPGNPAREQSSASCFAAMALMGERSIWADGTWVCSGLSKWVMLWPCGLNSVLQTFQIPILGKITAFSFSEKN